MPLALEGIRVIDMAQALAGPGSSMYLADQGAEVIKIEPPGGDDSRQQSNDPVLGNNSRSFMVLNRNKRGITLDIRKPAGRKVLYKLVGESDVIITNMREKTLARLQADYESLRKVNPRIVFGHVTGWGTSGPYAEKGGFDRLTQGMSGAMHRKWADGTPVTAGVWISDCSVPMLMAYGIMLALWQREKTGVGQKVETSLLQAAVAMQSNALVRVDKADPPYAEFDAATYGIYKCADGNWINITALRQKQAVALFRLLDLPHLAEDPRANDPAKRAEFRDEVFPIIEALLETKPSGEWLRLLDEIDVPAAPILKREDVFFEPQLTDTGIIATTEHPKAGTVRMFGPPVNLSDAPSEIRSAAPLLGQHTDEVLRELGYSEGQIGELRAAEVI